MATGHLCVVTTGHCDSNKGRSCNVCVCVCVCVYVVCVYVGESAWFPLAERTVVVFHFFFPSDDRDIVTNALSYVSFMCVSVCLCVCVRERLRERECVCVCE